MGQTYIQLGEGIRTLVQRAVNSRSWKAVEERLHETLGDSLLVKAGAIFELNAHRMHRYGLAMKTSSERNLRQRFLEVTGLGAAFLYGTEADRFFEENT